MIKLLVIHSMPSTIPIAKVKLVTNAAKFNSSPDAYWVGSSIQLNDKGQVSKITCEWEAKDYKSLKICLKEMRKAIPEFTADGPYLMTKVEDEPQE